MASKAEACRRLRLAEARRQLRLAAARRQLRLATARRRLRLAAAKVASRQLRLGVATVASRRLRFAVATGASRRLRRKGNQSYAKGCHDNLTMEERSRLLLEAAEFYRKAFNASQSDDERAQCSENLADAHWRHAKFFLKVFPDGFVPFEFSHPCFDIRLSLEYYFAALHNGRASNQSTEWRRNINKKLVAMARFIVHLDGWILADPQFASTLNEMFESEVSPDEKSLGWAIWSSGFAKNNFARALAEFRSKDHANGVKINYRKCLFLLHLCHGPLKEAERRFSSECPKEMETLKSSVDHCRATCESLQAGAAGQRLLAKSLSTKDGALRHKLAISALGKFREAAVIVRGMDAECQAFAKAEVGDVYRDVLQMDDEIELMGKIAHLPENSSCESQSVDQSL